MTFISSRPLRTAIATVAAGLFTGIAIAGDTPDSPPSPEQIAQVCIQRVANQTQAAGTLIAGNTATGVARIGILDGNDAPVPVLITVAQNTRQQSQFVGASTVSTVQQITRRCVVRLQAIDADPTLIESVVQARQQSQMALVTAVQTSAGAIGAALQDALKDEDLPGGDGDDGDGDGSAS